MTRGSTAWAAVVTLIFFLASFAGTTPFNLHDANIAQVSIASGIGMIGCLYGGIRTLLALIFASTLAFGLGPFCPTHSCTCHWCYHASGLLSLRTNLEERVQQWRRAV